MIRSDYQWREYVECLIRDYANLLVSYDGILASLSEKDERIKELEDENAKLRKEAKDVCSKAAKAVASAKGAE